MFSVRRRNVEKRNSRGEIVKKEEVFMMTRKFHHSTEAPPKISHRSPTFSPPPSNPKKRFPLSNPQRLSEPLQERQNPLGFDLSNPPRQNFGERCGRRQSHPVFGMNDFDREKLQGHQLSKYNKEEIEYLLSGLLRRQQDHVKDSYMQSYRGRQQTQQYSGYQLEPAKNQGGYNARGFDEEGTDVEDSNAEDSYAEEDSNNEDSDAEDSNNEDSDAEDSKNEDSDDEDSHVEDSDAEDSDDEPPRSFLADPNRRMRNLSTWGQDRRNLAYNVRSFMG
ncbi:unnamed protein product [Sphenostylis stenocarpa]|uniref:Uncharacterized protein n=1 Tax=Sphenostylis stenocarpa TaxID=92480 RepID=A0AA86SIB6_9FABA|nr:unnamed protein product [Sphenostylis stenocarpa]